MSSINADHAFQASGDAIFAGFAVTGLSMFVVIFGAMLSTTKNLQFSLTPNQLMSITLSLCSGSTISISFHLLFSQTLQSFAVSGHSPEITSLYTAISFLVGVACIYIGQLVVSRAVRGVVKELDIFNNMVSPSSTHLEAIPTLSNANDHKEILEIQGVIQLRRIVYVTCAIVFVADVLTGTLIYSGLTRKLSFPFEVQLFLVIANTVLTHFPFGLAVGLPTFQLTSSKKTALLYAFYSSTGLMIGCVVSYIFIDSTNTNLLGIIRGVSAGMFVCFAFREQLRTAYFLDPEDNRVSTITFASIVFMQAIMGLCQYSI